MEYEDRLTIATAEGVDMRLTLAGVGSRFASAIVDGIIQYGTLAAVYVVAGATDGFGLGGWGAAIAIVATFVVLWGYDVFFEVLASGRTPGKRLNGLRVVLAGGQPVTFLRSATRNLLRFVDILPGFYLVGCIAILVSSKNQRLGDVVAGTIVVRDRRAAQESPGALAHTPRELPPELAVWDTSAITADELAAVRRFLERRHEIELAPRNELAATLAERLRPKVAGAPEEWRGERFLEALAAVKSARG